MRYSSYRHARRLHHTARVKQKHKAMSRAISHYFPTPFWDKGKYIRRTYLSTGAGSRAHTIKHKASRATRYTDDAYNNSSYKRLYDVTWKLW